MEFGLNSFLITVAFILPGFITTRLLYAKTPSIGRKQSLFEETTESLLRSVYINLLVGSLFLLAFQSIYIPRNSYLFSDGLIKGISLLTSEEPFLVILFFLGWLLVSFCVAFIFGYYWDPLHYFMERLASRTGTLTEDPFYLIRTAVHEKRLNKDDTSQLWLRARLKDGGQYQGEFVFGGYPSEGKPREILLSQAIYYQKDSQESSQVLDFVFIDFSNCLSLEFVIVQPSS